MNATEKIQRLRKLMGDQNIQELNDTISKILEEDPEINKKDLNKRFIFPKIRQHGFKVQVKKRQLPTIHFNKDGIKRVYAFTHPLKSILLKSIEKKIQEKKTDFSIDGHMIEIIKYLYSKGALVDLDHYSVWINNQVYHWGPGTSWTVHGPNETDREIANEWSVEADPDFGQVAFTLRTKPEIDAFCQEFQNKKFDLENTNSQTFKDELITFLVVDY